MPTAQLGTAPCFPICGLSLDMYDPIPNACMSVLSLCRKIPGNIDTNTLNLLENKFNFLSLNGH